MENKTSKLRRTRLSKKMLLIFEDFIRTKKATDFIRTYREKLGIPEDGLCIKKIDVKRLSVVSEKYEDFPLCFVPEEIFPLPDGTRSSEENKVKILYECDDFLNKNGFDSSTLSGLFRFYVYYNETLEFPLNLFKNNQIEEMATIEFLPRIQSYCEFNGVSIDKYMSSNLKERQIMLCFNPEASLNEIKDFLSKNWSFVKKYKKEEISRQFNKRSKPRLLVNDFIYRHRDLKISEIRTKLASELKEFLDDGHIGKILSIENKKRN